jgi:biopolymer transport protein ExbD
MPPFPKDVSSKLDYTRVISLCAGELLPETEIMRNLGKANMAIGKFYETKGEFGKAEEIYLTTLIMGKRIAEQKPLALIKMLVGITIDSMARNALEEIYSAQGMQEKVQWAQNGKKKLEEIHKLTNEKATEMSKHASPFWTKKEIELKMKGKDLLFLESSLVREMLNIWPVVNIQTETKQMGSKPSPVRHEVKISILAEDNVLVFGEKTPPHEAGKKLEALGVNKDTLIIFSINGDLPYKFVQRVMSSINHAGYNHLSVTEVK